MSLYAILPTASPCCPAGFDLALRLTKQQQPILVDEEVMMTRASESPEKEIILDLSAIDPKGMGSRRNSLSSLSFDGLDASGKSITPRPPDHEWKIRVEEATIHRKIRSPRNTARSSLGRRRKRGNRNDKENDRSADLWNPAEQEEEAMEFRIVVSRSGREFSTQRTLLEIAQCRRDLVQEQEWRTRKHGDDSGRAVPRIPYLPAMEDDDQDSIDGYEPLLERWFADVLAIVSENNPILADFLWEPLDSSSMGSLPQSLDK